MATAVPPAPPKDLFASTKVVGLMQVGLETAVFEWAVAGLFSAKLACLDWLAELLTALTVIAWGNT
jgi:hypothetical protein